jgi:nitrite reductase/ring-hydroxylating ferredoxin subunit
MSAANEEQEATWSMMANLDELPTDGTGITVEVDGRAFAVFRVGDLVHVLDDTCPHEGASLGCGVISQGDVTCPWHGWHFDLEKGSSSDGLPERVGVYPTRISEGGEVRARLGAS